MKAGTLFTLILLLSLCTVTARDLTVGELLARPRHYNGKRVSVIGYYRAGTEESCLFSSREAAKRFELAHSVWVEFRGTPDLTAIADCTARVVGKFHFNPAVSAGILRTFGHNNLWSVALLDVTEFRPLR
jgi:hypothetical protein